MRKKIFAIYDLNVMPYSIGDVISFIAGVQVVMYRNNIDYYDICFIAHNNHYADNVFNNLINKHNRLHFFQKLVDTLQINNTLESIYYCYDYFEFHELYELKISHHLVWPELSAIQNKEYLHYRIYNELHNFNQEFKFLPTVFNSSGLTKWAYCFFKKHVGDSFPVTVNLRNNKLFSGHRNADIDCWLGFFSYCLGKFPIKFVVICAKNEIDERLYSQANVIIAKKLDTTISQDISLIANSPLHLGSASGPATICPFISHPSLILNVDMLLYIDLYKGALCLFRDKNHAKLSFSTDLQYYSTFPETTDYLIYEFEKLWQAVDVDAWVRTSHYWQNFESLTTCSWLD